MDGMDAGVMDTPVEETPEVEVEQPELGSAEPEQPEVETPEVDKDNPFTTQFSRDYRKFLNELKVSNPEAAKYLQQAKNDYGRLFALQQLEPKGIDGIREKYAILDSLTHGEAKGPEALAAMQQSLQEAEEVDGYILNGDPKAFESMGKEFDQGLAKLAPAYLGRLQSSSPEAFEAAVMPHVVGMLQKTPVIEQFNYLVDVLNGKYGQLDEKTKLARTVDALQQMAEGFNGLAQKATAAKPTTQVDPQASQLEERQTKLDQAEQTHHWNTKIEPLVSAQHDKLFDQHFKQYAQRLKLNDKNVGSLKAAFRQGIIDEARKDRAYQRQHKAFKGQKNPDPATVSNYVNNWMTGKAKNILDEKVNERYGGFLAGKPRPATAQAKPAVKVQGPAAPNVEVRTVMPERSEINFQRTPVEWMASSYPGGKKYILNNGKTIQIRPA